MSLSQPTFDDVWKLIHETNASLRETDKKLKQASESIGRLVKGDFVEEMVRPAALRLLEATVAQLCHNRVMGAVTGMLSPIL